jgi:cyclophilin family peptidyl-prolyl cis-trans isomerase
MLRKIVIVSFVMTILLYSGCDRRPQETPQKTQPAEKQTNQTKPVQETKMTAPAPKTTKVRIATSKGDIVVELNEGKAPITCKNFLQYVADKFYDGTIFHRVINGFMIQGGGMTADMRQKQTKPSIVNEASNGLKNDRGTIAMARTSDPDSATSQFFINHANNDFLNAGARDAGYAVIGKVTEGMDVVDAIAVVPTRPGDIPVETIVIESIRTE